MKTTPMLVSPSEAAGTWRENRDGNTWRNLQPYPGHYTALETTKTLP